MPTPDEPVLTLPFRAWALLAASLVAGYITFRTGVDFSARWIWDRPEYGHGLIIPFVSAFLIWQRRDQLERMPFCGSWWGVALLLVGVALNLLGRFASLFIIQQYSAVIALYGLVLALLGGAGFRRIWVPLLLILFMIPFPEFVLQNLSAQLQLISSAIGVWVIRLFGISVNLEGNVIDLGVFQLQVAEACDGLRYLFPLMTLGFIMAYFFRASLWKRVLLFLSSIPITILMNSLRIGIIGVTVQHWGIRMAEGFLHQFQGWVIFMSCLALMMLEVVVLARLGPDRRSWREVFGVEWPAPAPPGAPRVARAIPASFLAAFCLLVVAAVVGTLLPDRAEIIPARHSLVDFPSSGPGWALHRQALDPIYLDELKLDDYLLADVVTGDGPPINFYVAWYNSQRAGHSTHSPRTCLPSGGWEVESFSVRDLPADRMFNQPLSVNRALISRQGQRQLVYYWFAQRGRVQTNEYAVKWDLFVDAIRRNRSDGALVRLTVLVRDGESIDAVDARLTRLAGLFAPALEPYLPD